MLDLLCSLIPVMDLLQRVEAAIHVTDPKIDFQKINQILFLMSSEQAGVSPQGVQACKYLKNTSSLLNSMCFSPNPAEIN